MFNMYVFFKRKGVFVLVPNRLSQDYDYELNALYLM